MLHTTHALPDKMLPGSQLFNSYTRLKSQYPFDLWFVQRLNSWQTIMFYDSQPSWFASHSSQNIICNKNRDQIAYFDGWLIHTLEQPCSTSGQLAECGQKGHFVLPNAPLPQKKVETTHFCLVTQFEKMRHILQSVLWPHYSVTSEILVAASIL